MKTPPAPQILALLLAIGADGKTQGPLAQAKLTDQ
jgi:hypothetical protein